MMTAPRDADRPSGLEHHRRTQAQQIAAALYDRGANRVWLFGSLSRGAPADVRTDVDLAVHGLGQDELDGLLRQLRPMLACRLDIIAVESAPPGLKRSICASRVLLQRAAPDVPLARGLAASFEPGLRSGLWIRRLHAVARALRDREVCSVLDLGCGAGRLLQALAPDPRIRRLTGLDVSAEALEQAAALLKNTHLCNGSVVELTIGMATTAQPNWLGFDALTAVEVIEHIDPERVCRFDRSIFGFARPRVAVITTPNREYNVMWRGVGAGRRHPGHRFEWTRDEFAAWVRNVQERFGYVAEIGGVGDAHPAVGAPTQMAVFTRP